MVVGDSIGRTLFYYAPLMETYNVSRIRLGNDSFIPHSTEIVSLAPIDYDDIEETLPVYAAFDTLGNMFYTVICTYSDDTASKIFLVTDPETGLETLTSEELRGSVTGGPVDHCYPLPLSNGQPGL